MGLQEWFFGRKVKSEAEKAERGDMGKAAQTAWAYLSGWKSFIVLAVLIGHQVFPGFQGFGYVDAVINALGWQTATLPADPAQCVAVGSAVLALGHKLWKAAAEIKAGVRLRDLQSTKLPDGSVK
jgi:hypothetical protein